MKYLLDTVVVSELRKRRRDPALVGWLRSVPSSDVFLSVITIGEIERGITRQRAVDPGLAAALATWLDAMLADYANQIIPVDVRIARRWARLSVTLGHSGADVLIAATALEQGLAVATRNVRHFADTGVDVVDPFAAPAG